MGSVGGCGAGLGREDHASGEGWKQAELVVSGTPAERQEAQDFCSAHGCGGTNSRCFLPLSWIVGFGKPGSRENIHFTPSLICAMDVGQGPTGCLDTVGTRPDAAAPANLHASGETGHCHRSRRRGSLLERGRLEQIPGRKPGTRMTMCAVKQEGRRGTSGGLCKGSVAPGSRVVWRC